MEEINLSKLYDEVFNNTIFDVTEGERYPCLWDRSIVIVDKNLPCG